MGFVVLAIVWVLCPFALIPMTIVFHKKAGKYKSEADLYKKRLEVEQGILNRYRSAYGDIDADGSNASMDVIPTATVHPQVANNPVGEPSAVRNQPPKPAVNQPQRPPRPVREKKPLTSGQLLFGIGVLCVSIAGIIFATTTWSILADEYKFFLLILASMFCYGVSYILKTKLDLKESSVAFFVMGSIFLPLTIVVIGYFEWFGQWFSFKGDGRYLIGCLCFALMSASLIAGKKFYGINILKLFAFISYNISVLYLIKQIAGKGDIVMLVYAIYQLLQYAYISLEKTPDGIKVLSGLQKREDAIFKASRIMCLIIVALSVVVYVGSGNSTAMALVFVVDQLILTAIAIVEGYTWAYQVIPVFGMLFAVDVAASFKDIFAYGNIVVFLIVTFIQFVLCKLIRIKEKNILDVLSLYIITTLEMLFISLWAGFELSSAEDVIWSEYIVMALLFTVVTIGYAFIYIKNSARYNKGERSMLPVKLILLYICSAVGLYSSCYIYTFSVEFSSINNVSSCIKSYMPLGIVTGVFITVAIIKNLQIRSNTLSDRIILTDLLTLILVNLSVFISFVMYMDVRDAKHFLLGIPLVLVMILIQVHGKLRGNNILAVLTALLMPITIGNSLKNLLYSGDKALEIPIGIRANNFLETGLVTVLIIMIIGLFAYKKIINVNKEKKQIILDWNLPMAVIMIFGLGVSISQLDNLDFRILVAFALVAIYVSRKLSVDNRKWAYLVAACFMCLAWWAQEFFFWPTMWEMELRISILIPFAALLYFVLFRESKKIVAWVCYGLAAVCMLVQWFAFDDVSYDSNNIYYVKLALFFVTTIGTFAYAAYRKKVRYDLMTEALSFLALVRVFDDWTWIAAGVMAVISVALIVYLYRRSEELFVLVPLVNLILLSGEVIGRIGREDGYFGDNSIVVWTVCWIIVLAILLSIGRFLHRNIFEKREGGLPVIDWFTIEGIGPVMMLFYGQTDKLRWCGMFVMAIYLMSYYKRINPVVSKIISTIASIIMALCWWLQPFVDIDPLFVDEWRIAGYLLLVYTISKRIFKKELDKAIDFMYWASAISIVWQCVSAIRSARVFDVIILGVVLLGMIVVSYILKTRKWFLLSTISLAVIVLYMSRGFFKLIAWWVYLLVAGVVLISLAVSSEFFSKNVQIKPKLRNAFNSMFSGWNK